MLQNNLSASEKQSKAMDMQRQRLFGGAARGGMSEGIASQMSSGQMPPSTPMPMPNAMTQADLDDGGSKPDAETPQDARVELQQLIQALQAKGIDPNDPQFQQIIQQLIGGQGSAMMGGQAGAPGAPGQAPLRA